MLPIQFNRLRLVADVADIGVELVNIVGVAMANHALANTVDDANTADAKEGNADIAVDIAVDTEVVD